MYVWYHAEECHSCYYVGMRFVSKNLEETKLFAQDILSLLKERADSSRATLLTLSGDLGSGKTTLAQCLAELLGVSDVVTSPTFVLRSDYVTSDSVFPQLYHLDAYRLDSYEEFLTTGWEALLLTSSLVVLEWPEKVLSTLPPHTCSVEAFAEGSVHTFSFSCI